MKSVCFGTDLTMIHYFSALTLITNSCIDSILAKIGLSVFDVLALITKIYTSVFAWKSGKKVFIVDT